MITGAINRTEKAVSFWNVPRFSGLRANRYVSKRVNEVQMIRLLKDFLTETISNKNFSKAVEDAINKAIKQAKELGWSEGLLASYKGEYVIVFLKVKGLDHCAIKITHNEEERNLVNNFYMSSSEEERIAFSLLCLNICREKQMVNMLRNEPTYGIIYTNYPEQDECIDTFMQYININQAGKIASIEAISAVKRALDRGCSEEEILSILPVDVESKFLNVVWNDFEIAQLEALTPNVAQSI